MNESTFDLDPRQFTLYTQGVPQRWLNLSGARISHSTFGQGNVLQVTLNSENDPNILIEFDSIGTKLLGSLAGTTALSVSETVHHEAVSVVEAPPAAPVARSISWANPINRQGPRPKLLPVGEVFWYWLDPRENETYLDSTGVQQPIATSYLEIKERGVIAQGLPQIRPINQLFQHTANKEKFIQEFLRVGDRCFQPGDFWHKKGPLYRTRCATSFYNLFRLKPGDLIVARQGGAWMGLCQVTKRASGSYEFQDGWAYSHVVCSPVEWIDWNWIARQNENIVSPARGFGLVAVEKYRKQLIDYWKSFCVR